MADIRLHLGCGRNILPGWVNVDCKAMEGVDLVLDLNTLKQLPLDRDSVSEILASHLLEHIPNILPLMAELYRVAKPDAILTAHVPYGSSDDAWEDPTHCRAFFVGSWGYFAQPTYWRADYGYSADWQPETVRLRMPRRPWLESGTPVRSLLLHQRNVVTEMVATLRKVSPARPPDRQLMVPPRIEIEPIDRPQEQ
jgi:SAM-dependent methyltransferase